jgi:hypothetical protein
MTDHGPQHSVVAASAPPPVGESAVALAALGYPDRHQHAAWRRMSSIQKHELFVSHMNLMRELKTAGVKASHPDWSEERVKAEVARIYLHGQS